jgi:hypothetical protein
MVAALAANVCADEDDTDNEDVFDNQPAVEVPHKNIGVWPAFLVISEIPSAERTPDVVGLRITVPYSVKHESVTGFDIGLWGRAQHFEGFMCSLLRNDVKDTLTGIQAGIYNSAERADLLGGQLGVWNQAGTIRGFQAGVINTAGMAQGIQVGLVNRAEEMYGIQIGLVNVIRCAEVRFCPLVNIGF